MDILYIPVIFHPITSVSTLCKMPSQPPQYQQVSSPSAWGELQVICSLIVAIPHTAGQPRDLMDPHILTGATAELWVEKTVYLQLWFQIFWVQNYNAVMWQHSPHIRHPIACPSGQDMGSVLWIWSLTYIVPKFLQWWMQYHIILGCLIKALDCSLSAMAITMNTSAKYVFNHISRLPGIVWKCPLAVIQFMLVHNRFWQILWQRNYCIICKCF